MAMATRRWTELGRDSTHLLGGVVVPGQFGENVPGVAAARSRELAQFWEVLSVACQLDQDANGVVVAGIGKPAQLIQIAAFFSALDQLVRCIAVTVGCGFAQPGKVFGHCPLLAAE
jgi:hypothetical protein